MTGISSTGYLSSFLGAAAAEQAEAGRQAARAGGGAGRAVR